MGWLRRIVDAGQAEHQPIAALADALFLDVHDRRRKRSAFWALLTLSAVIAAGGIIGNSTATVVGAMIIAPLGTPIYGLALGVVIGARRQLFAALRLLVAASAVAIAIGALCSAVVPSRLPVELNPQITGRTSATVLDLVVALATGTAGAFGLTRRDIAPVLPGVAIAISLVPPLATVGYTAGGGHWQLAAGALLLFGANVIAIVIAGTVVFATAGYAEEAVEHDAHAHHYALAAVAIAVMLLLVPLGLNSTQLIAHERWLRETNAAVRGWLAGSEWRLESTDVAGDTIALRMRGNGEPPPVEKLRAQLDGKIPRAVRVRVEMQYGKDLILDWR
ncbi:MAG: hypothetical protein JWN44_5954 [Myxococcales bacterium]|nr:hypothetical protein [Myxococcales bacterium]